MRRITWIRIVNTIFLSILANYFFSGYASDAIIYLVMIVGGFMASQCVLFQIEDRISSYIARRKSASDEELMGTGQNLSEQEKNHKAQYIMLYASWMIALGTVFYTTGNVSAERENHVKAIEATLQSIQQSFHENMLQIESMNKKDQLIENMKRAIDSLENKVRDQMTEVKTEAIYCGDGIGPNCFN